MQSLPEAETEEAIDEQYTNVCNVELLTWLNGTLDSLPDNHVLGFDVETNGFYWKDDIVVGFSVAWEDGTAAYVPYVHTDRESWGFGRAEVRALLQKLKRFRIVCHKAVFDTTFAYETFGVALPMWDDTYLLAKLTQSPLALDDLMLALFGFGKTKDFSELMAELFGRTWKSSGASLAHATSTQTYQYCCRDSDGSRRSYFAVKPLIQANKLGSLHKIEINLLPQVRKLNVAGAPIDPEKAAFVAGLLQKQNDILEQEIYDIAGYKFKINSPRDLPTLLFGPAEEGGLALPILKRSDKTGAPSTDEETLRALEDAHEIVPKIKKWREDTRLWKAYFDKLPHMVDAGTGRVHTEFNSYGAISGRFTSSGSDNHEQVKKGMNLQNVANSGADFAETPPTLEAPVGLDLSTITNKAGEIDGVGLWEMCRKARQENVAIHQIPSAKVRYRCSVRECFVAPPGFVWVKADYSQIEYRLLANFSGEELLIQRFKNGIDFHTSTASLFLDKPVEQVTKPDRDQGKIVNYTLGYGGGANKVARTLGISQHEAERGFERYWSALPKVRDLQEFTKARAKNDGYTKTFFGFKRTLQLDGVPSKVRDSNLRKSLNTMIQGSAAEFLKIGMLRVEPRIRKYGKDAEMILTVHDELDFLVRTEILFEVIPQIAIGMRVPTPPDWAPIEVDISYGPTWAESSHTKWKPPADIQWEEFVSWGKVLPAEVVAHADI